jgi:hypothetical protein
VRDTAVLELIELAALQAIGDIFTQIFDEPGLFNPL